MAAELTIGTAGLLQDGVRLHAAAVQALVAGLAQRLEPGARQRVALISDRADAALVALLACQRAGCDLLLWRQATPPDAPVWRELGVSALLDGELDLVELPLPRLAEASGLVLLATSGTTGTPKVAMHRLERLLGRVRAPRDAAAAQHDRVLLTYHPCSFAGLQVLLTALVSGAELLAVSRSTVASLAAAALAHRPTLCSGTPTFWRGFMLALGPQAAAVPLRHITLGGEAVDQVTLDRLRQCFPAAGIVHIYASTEAGALYAVRDGRAGFPRAWLDEGIDGVSLRIRDGALQVRSPRAMQAYVAGAGASPIDADGWLSTGDLVEAEGDRVLFRGRVDSVINVGGAKVRPEEIEAALLELPQVADVRAFAARNPITGELVGVELVLAEGLRLDDVRPIIVDHARQRLGGYKVPRVLRQVTALDASATGKKQRGG